jgi:hypothetical protein
MACGELFLSSVLDCNNIIQGGVGDDSRLILILKKDITATTTDTLGRVTAFTLAAGKTAYSIDGIKQSLKPRYEMQVSPSGQTVYRHQVDFFYFEYAQNHKNNIQAIGNGRYLALFSNAKADSNAFEVLGTDVGLEMTAALRAPQENGGAFSITLASPENEFETKLPATFLATDYAGSLTAIAGYLKLPTITSFSVSTFVGASGGAPVFTGTNYFGGGTNSAVTSIQAINKSTGAIFPSATTSFAISSVTDTGATVTIGAAALTAGIYTLRLKTTKGSVDSVLNLIVT